MRALRIVLGLFITVLVVGVGLYMVLTKDGTGGPGATIAPAIISDFTFPDRMGTRVAFDDVDARIRIITFWASWSPYSKTELPALSELKKVYGVEVEVVALNRDVNPGEGKVFFDSLDLGDELIELYDQGDELYAEVGGYAMPETIFVDRKGRVLIHVHGPMGYDEMKATLERLLR